jgi:hypothetical protein
VHCPSAVWSVAPPLFGHDAHGAKWMPAGVQWAKSGGGLPELHPPPGLLRGGLATQGDAARQPSWLAQSIGGRILIYLAVKNRAPLRLTSSKLLPTCWHAERQNQ